MTLDPYDAESTFVRITILLKILDNNLTPVFIFGIHLKALTELISDDYQCARVLVIF